MNAPERIDPATAGGSADPIDAHLPCVLVVDDEVRSQEAMRRTLEEDFQVLTASNAATARTLLERHRVAVILCDQRMPGQSGVDFLKAVRAQWPEVVRVVISGYADSEDIIAGVNEAGIYQYVLKPWVPEHLLGTVRSAVEASTLQQGLHRLELDLRAGTPALRARLGEKLRQARSVFDFERIVRAPGSPLDAVCTVAERVARHDLSVLVLGESGTGKELMARAIHYASPRAGRPFVVENCAAIPDTLLESELFGHKRGAFTGAVEDHVGLIQRADGGTLFLDEVGETSPLFQVKLLRVLQEGELRPVGSTRTVPVDVRIIAATHRQLEDEVRAGRFREDLYYRLNGLTLHLPPLRERSDLQGLVARLLADIAPQRPVQVAPDLLQAFAAYRWPGNLRQLANALRTACALAADDEGELGWAHLPDDLAEDLRALAATTHTTTAAGATATTPAHAATPGDEAASADLRAQSDRTLARVVAECSGNLSEAARRLGISRNTLYRRMAELGLR